MSANQNITFLDKKSQRCVNKTRPQTAKHTLKGTVQRDGSGRKLLIREVVIKERGAEDF